MTIIDNEGALFEIEAPPPVSLRDRFGVPPFSILDRRIGEWQERRRRWLGWGIESEIGRGENLLNMSDAVREGYQKSMGFYQPGAGAGVIAREGGGWTGTSVFDPVLCELAYRWYTAPGNLILDPFAGGSVRGVVAGLLERRYMGIDLRGEQIAANREQASKIFGEERSAWMPRWATGDSRELAAKLPAQSVDFIFSCPPYADLEVYSDDPADISTLPWEEFCEAHAEIILESCRALRQDRFAAWVTSDVRDKRGIYRGLGVETIRAFEEAGLRFYNEGIVLDPVGSAAVRAGRIFNGGRKLTRMHQYFYVFVKGDPKKATQQLGDSELQRGAEA